MPLAICPRQVPKWHLWDAEIDATMWRVEPPIEHRDVTTIMRLLSDIQVDVHEIRELLEEDEGGEEETLENDG
jgi:hypothetical protein